jgi:hypothetical protein
MGKPKFVRQGEFDGLCGQYAIINALTECGTLKSWEKQEEVFKISLKCAKSKMAIYCGAYLSDVKKLLKALPAEMLDGLSVEYPFSTKGADRIPMKRKSDQYVEQLANMLNERTVACAMIGIKRKSDDWSEHWIVVKGKGRYFEFIDSINRSGRNPIKKRRASLGIAHRHDGQEETDDWRIVYPRYVVLFRKNAELGCT